MTDIR